MAIKMVCGGGIFARYRQFVCITLLLAKDNVMVFIKTNAEQQ
jgi:hypothetical protein